MIVLLLVAVKLAHSSSGSGSSGSKVTSGKHSSNTSITKGHQGVTTTTTTDPIFKQTGGTGGTGLFTNSHLSNWMKSRTGILTAAIYDLDNHQVSIWNGSQSHEYAASIVKVDILATLMYQAQGRAQTLSASQQALAKEMIENSSDSAATSLYQQIGGPSKLNAFNRLIGMQNTVANKHWGATTTTAQDQLVLLKALAGSDSVLDAKSRNYILDLMGNVVPDQAFGVSYGAPKSSTVALKNGWLELASKNWQVNSIGYISGGGADYLIAVLTSGSPNQNYGVGTIEGISELASPLMVAGSSSGSAQGSTSSTSVVQGHAGTTSNSNSAG